jgi:glycosyltransferase involved in cell wall biosynthesis
MKVSLITVCYNSAGTIRTALESVFRQKGVELEYIVVDGGSNDGTVDVIKEYEGRILEWRSGGVGDVFEFKWISECDRGMYDAINKGIKMATGDIIGILNADDYLDGEDVLARIVKSFNDDNSKSCSFECIFGNVRFVKEVGGKTQRVCFARLWRPWMLHWGYMPPHPAIFIRRECFSKWGGYEPSRKEYRIAADYELLVRYFCRRKISYKYVPICTTVMRLGGVSTKDIEARKKLNEEIIKANRVNGYFCTWLMLLPKYAIKVWEVILPKLGVIK